MSRRALRKIDPSLDLARHLRSFEELPRPWDAAALFGRAAPLEVEVGSGKGLFLRSAAADRPDANFLGIEVARKYAQFAAASLAKAGVRNIIEFNTRVPEEHLPYLVVVVDELADLMLQAPDETERTITRLAQLARATGIHLILATQRPSVNVVTGLIKANFPARIAFAVASNVDSRVILDQPGAERLLGRGDMLYQAPDAAGPLRVQGAFVSDSETNRLVDYWRLEASTKGGTPSVPGGGSVDALPSGVPLKQGALWDDESGGGPNYGDPLMGDAIDLVRREGRASITMLQRRMRVGYTRAARLIDGMEEKGIIGPPVANSQVREVLDYGQTIPPKEE